MRKLFLSMVVTLFVSLSSTASAACCDLGAVVGAVNSAKSAIVSTLNEIKALIEVAAKANIKANNENARQDRDMAAEVMTQAKMLDIQQSYQPPSDPCALGAADVIARLNSQYPVIKASVRGGGRGAGSAVGDSQVTAALTGPSPTPEVSARITVASHGKLYCDEMDVKAYGNAGCPAGASPVGMPGADVKADSLFTGAGRGDANHPTQLTFNAQQQDAARMYLRNVDSAIAPKMLNKAEVETEQGKMYLALYHAYRARVDLGSSVAEDALVARLPSDAGKLALNELIGSNGSAKTYLQKYQQMNKVDYAKGISEIDFMNFEVDRRYANTEWYAKDLAVSGEALTREGIALQALQTKIAWKNYLMQERNTVLLGQVLTLLTRQELEPRLNAQYQSIQRR